MTKGTKLSEFAKGEITTLKRVWKESENLREKFQKPKYVV